MTINYTYRYERLQNTEELNLKVVRAIDIEASVFSAWEALAATALWPEWFGYSEVAGELEPGPHTQLNSPFTTLLQVLYPFRESHRAARLVEIIPLRSACWEAQGHELQATHTWELIPLETFDGMLNPGFKPRTRLSVEVTFRHMTAWYFNVMGVAQKVQSACDLLLAQIEEKTIKEIPGEVYIKAVG